MSRSAHAPLHHVITHCPLTAVCRLCTGPRAVESHPNGLGRRRSSHPHDPTVAARPRHFAPDDIMPVDDGDDDGDASRSIEVDVVEADEEDDDDEVAVSQRSVTVIMEEDEGEEQEPRPRQAKAGDRPPPLTSASCVRVAAVSVCSAN